MAPNLSSLERDLQMQAKTLSELTLDQRSTNDDIAELKQNEALRRQRDVYIDERFARNEASVTAVYGLGKWVLAAVGVMLLTAIGNIIFKGPIG